MYLLWYKYTIKCLVYNVVGEQFRLARLRRDLTMDQVAQRAQCTRLTLARLEKGEPTVSLGVVMYLLWYKYTIKCLVYNTLFVFLIIFLHNFEWSFTIDDKDFQPLFNELNKYIMGPTFRWHRLMEKAAV